MPPPRTSAGRLEVLCNCTRHSGSTIPYPKRGAPTLDSGLLAAVQLCRAMDAMASVPVLQPSSMGLVRRAESWLQVTTLLLTMEAAGRHPPK